MSKYLANKLMRLVNMDDAARSAYVADPPGFVAQWEATQRFTLEPEERQALASRDYERLYALGTNAHLLWSFTQAVWGHELPRVDLLRAYNERTARHGYPDSTT